MPREYKTLHIPNALDEIYSVSDWEEVKWMMYDQGTGYWMKDGYVSKDDVDETEPEDATHVLWFSK